MLNLKKSHGLSSKAANLKKFAPDNIFETFFSVKVFCNENYHFLGTRLREFFFWEIPPWRCVSV